MVGVLNQKFSWYSKKLIACVIGLLAGLLALPLPGHTESPYGPQATITCPAGAVNISPSQNIPSVVDSYAPGTTFCVLVGTHYPQSPINLKTNQKLIGQYGAVIDGSYVTMSYDQGSTAIIRAWNCGGDCSGATVQNLVLKNRSNYSCIAVGYNGSDNWTIDHNEITGCTWGVNMGYNSGGRITYNYIHHNIGDPAFSGGYGISKGSNIIFSNNEISYNSGAQKVGLGTNVTFRDNWVHHNNNGIWYDSDNVGSVIEGNLVEDNAGEGIHYEISGGGVIRHNLIKRNKSSGIFIATSRDVEVHNNTLLSNGRGLNLIVRCASVLPAGQPWEGAIGWDLRNVNMHDNVVAIDNRSDVYASTLSYTSDCSATQVAPYINGSKNLVFRNNHYYVPSLTGWYWLWAGASVLQFSAWQNLGHDTTGSVQLGTPPVEPVPPPPPASGVTISVNPTSANAGTQVTVSVSGITNPVLYNWIGIYPSGANDYNKLQWIYLNSCTQTPGSAPKSSGSCPLTLPGTAGVYDIRLFDGGYTRLASTSVTVLGSTAPVPVPAPPSDTTAPTTTITSPVNNAVVARKTAVSITANASDNVGVTKVEFYVNAGLVCTDTSAPYGCSWRTPASATKKTFNVQSKAYDTAGNVGSSAAVKITSN